MWGNTLGWTMSAVVVIFTLVVGGKIYSAGEITGTTDFSTGDTLKPLDMPVPDDVVTQTDGGDAGNSYRAAIAGFRTVTADNFWKNPVTTPPGFMQLILDATHKSQMSLFLDNPQDVVGYDMSPEPTTTAETLGTDMVKAGMVLLKKGQKDAAIKYFDAVFAFGSNLYRERVCYAEYTAGYDLMSMALQALTTTQPANSEKQQEYQKEKDAIDAYHQNHVQPIWNVISSINPSSIEEHAGDIYKLAAKAKDRMVRVEAILKLGRYRYYAARPADQDLALHYIEKYVNDPDPAVRFAASQAKSLTVEDYRSKIH